MAVVEPLRSFRFEKRPDPDRVNVIRLVEYLGPVSPELVLVDPELAARARALLSDAPGVRASRRERDEPIPLRLAASPDSRERRWRVDTVLGVAAVASVFFSLGLSTAATGSDPVERETRPPPVATPSSKAVPGAPAGSARAPSKKPKRPRVAPKPRSTPPTFKPAPTAPRFVWPAHPGARRYRLALLRDGRRVFERDVGQPALQLPATWSFRGRLERLTRGTYRWVVWPLLGPERQLGPAIVSAQYVF